MGVTPWRFKSSSRHQTTKRPLTGPLSFGRRRAGSATRAQIELPCPKTNSDQRHSRECAGRPHRPRALLSAPPRYAPMAVTWARAGYHRFPSSTGPHHQFAAAGHRRSRHACRLAAASLRTSTSITESEYRRLARSEIDSYCFPTVVRPSHPRVIGYSSKTMFQW